MSNKDLFNTCIIRVGMPPVIDAIIDRIVKNKEKYVPVVKATGVPWWWIGIIHIMEAAGRFDCHLHNGDPLTARTTHEPKGRPLLGKPPFTWCDSAIDALHSRGLVKPNNLPGEGADYLVWSLAFALDKMERYNGLGYRKTNIVSPYLWAGSTHYTKGKFVADGKFDPNAISKQIGGAVILSRMKARHILEI